MPEMQAQSGPTPGFQNPLAGTADSMLQRPGGFGPMPSTGAPGGGAAGKAPGTKQAVGQLPGGPQQPMPSTGAPGGGAAGKGPGVKQAIGQLPGGPPMQQRLGGALGNKMKRPRPQGMQPPNPMMGR
jgi:hypothetical protein